MEHLSPHWVYESSNKHTLKGMNYSCFTLQSKHQSQQIQKQFFLMRKLNSKHDIQILPVSAFLLRRIKGIEKQTTKNWLFIAWVLLVLFLSHVLCLDPCLDHVQPLKERGASGWWGNGKN